MCRYAPLPSDPYLLCSVLSDNEPEDILRYRCAYLAPDPYTGTQYPQGSRHLEKIWAGPSPEDVINKARSRPFAFCNLEQATMHLEDLWDSSLPSQLTKLKEQEVRQAIQRLRHIPRLQSWGPDIVYKAFDDLDLALFGGALRGGCKLRWTDSASFAEDHPDCEPMSGYATTCHELVSPDAVALPHEEVEPIHWMEKPYYCYISLNATSHFLEPMDTRDRTRWDEMWGTLLHEMVHAYLRVTINSHARVFEWTDPQREHGVHFQRCLRAINARAEDLELGVGGIFEEPWALQVEGGWLDVYGTAFYDEDEEAGTFEEGQSPPSTAPTSSSLGEIDPSCLVQASKLLLVIPVLSPFSLLTIL